MQGPIFLPPGLLRFMRSFRSQADHWRMTTSNEKLKRTTLIRLVISYHMDVIQEFQNAKSETHSYLPEDYQGK